jgi:hypothetical protein
MLFCIQDKHTLHHKSLSSLEGDAASGDAGFPGNVSLAPVHERHMSNALASPIDLFNARLPEVRTGMPS